VTGDNVCSLALVDFDGSGQNEVKICKITDGKGLIHKYFENMNIYCSKHRQIPMVDKIIISDDVFKMYFVNWITKQL